MAGIVKLLARAFENPVSTTKVTSHSYGDYNPFAQPTGNPFVTSNPFAFYGQNKPVSGGYFAGYYNNQPNIVGRRLFIEV